ncbi:MAG: hypothetical protein IAE90_15250 [Ignavibacteria bacterium]|mgnify:FL=1|nr:hypothetical protein [Ignavibacteria bacterium]
MSSYFDKLSEYYKSDKSDKDNQRFVKQARNTMVSSLIIIGIVFFLIVVVLIFSGLQSFLNLF